MRLRKELIAFSALMCLTCFNIGSDSAQTLAPTKYETVNVHYELTLSRCRNKVCQVEPAGTGQVTTQLDPEDRSYSWSAETVTDKIGQMTYYFYLVLSHDRRKGSRALQVTLAGRLFDAKQITWAQKSWTRTSWAAFPTFTISGNAFTDGGDTVTPTLKVKPAGGDFRQLIPHLPG